MIYVLFWLLLWMGRVMCPRFATTGEPEAAALAWQYYGGMRLLNQITGIHVRACMLPCRRRCVGPC